MKKMTKPWTANTQSRQRCEQTTSRSSALVRGWSTQFIANICCWPQRPCPKRGYISAIFPPFLLIPRRQRGTWEWVSVAIWRREWICRMRGGLVLHIIIMPAALSFPPLQGAVVGRAPTILQNDWFYTRISNFFQSPIFLVARSAISPLFGDLPPLWGAAVGRTLNTDYASKICSFFPGVKSKWLVYSPPKMWEIALWSSTKGPGVIPYFVVLPGSELSITEITDDDDCFYYQKEWFSTLDWGSMRSNLLW